MDQISNNINKDNNTVPTFFVGIKLQIVAHDQTHCGGDLALNPIKKFNLEENHYKKREEGHLKSWIFRFGVLHALIRGLLLSRRHFSEWKSR